jgi:beta-lactamase regulating signal transducer with metallopeptidase domain
MIILAMSISTSLFIISVAFVRILKLDFMAKVHRLFLWYGVIFNLLIPWRLPVKYNIFSLIQYLRNMLEQEQVYISGTDFIQIIGSESINVQNIWIISLIWLIGLCMVAAYFLHTHIRYRKLYKQALPTENLYVNEWRGKNRLKRKITILISDRVVTPLTYGLLNPIIILPKMVLELEQRQIEYILNHEEIHIRQYHIILKWMTALCVCMHWFNPIVWLAYVLINKDIELSCDEQVLWKLQDEDKKKYALLLIQLEAVRSNCFPLCNSFCRNLCEERISSIMKIKKLSIYKVIVYCL